MFMHAYVYMSMCTHNTRYTHTQAHTHTHIHTHTHALTHARTHAHTMSLSLIHAQTHTQTNAHTQTLARSLSDTNTHKHTHTHTLTRGGGREKKWGVSTASVRPHQFPLLTSLLLPRRACKQAGENSAQNQKSRSSGCYLRVYLSFAFRSSARPFDTPGTPR